ncbi:MAG: CesT family type III secretion system chaperone [Noviherbaspirillum sp.]
MTQNYQWRRQYIALVEDIFRELGFAPPEMTHDPDLPLAMELELEGATFEIVHSPGEHPQQILVECRFGTPPREREAAVLARLLEVNLELARAHQAAYGIDAATGEVIHAFRQALDQAGARALLETMKQIAVQAAQWRDTHFLDGAPAPQAPGFEVLA